MKKTLISMTIFLAILVYFQYTTSCKFAFKVNYDLKMPEPESHHVYFSGFQDVPVFTEHKYKDTLNEKTLKQFNRFNSSNDMDIVMKYLRAYLNLLSNENKEIVISNFSKDILNENNYYFVYDKNRRFTILIYDVKTKVLYEMIATYCYRNCPRKLIDEENNYNIADEFIIKEIEW